MKPVASIIQVENVTKVYRIGKVDVPALRGVSFAVEKGEFVTIVGPSGSGKSTLFYILGGLTRATEGRVVIDGADFAQMTDAQRTEMRKQKIGFVFQKFNLLPTLTAQGNIEIAREIAGSAGMDKAQFTQVTEMLGIAGRLSHRPAELSGGEQQRVAVARTLASRPRVLLLDEPFANLNLSLKDAILSDLESWLTETRTPVLYVTHDVAEAWRLGSRPDAEVLRMEDGCIVRQGPAAVVLAAERAQLLAALE